MKLTFLGTTCMVPTKERNASALLLSFENENILFDCGEGTQRQLKLAGITPTKITRIIISHWHGDHVLGLPGLLQTLGANEYTNKLKIYGPKGTKQNLQNMFKAFVFESKIDMEIIEIEKNGKLFDAPKFYIDAHELNHGIRCFGFRFVEKDRRRIKVNMTKDIGIKPGPLMGKLQAGKDIEFQGKKYKAEHLTYLVKGKKIAFIMDTVLCDNAYKLAQDADLLVSEAVYTSKLFDKALEYKHMTAQQAAQIASQSNVKKLIITHFSQRYKTADELLDDARTVFEETEAAYDLMKVKI